MFLYPRLIGGSKMALIKKRIPLVEVSRGVLVVNFNANAVSDNWLYAARLRQAAIAGDKDAAKELAELEATNMVYIIEKE